MGTFIGKLPTSLSKQLEWQQLNSCHGKERGPLMTTAVRPPSYFSTVSARHTIFIQSLKTLSSLKAPNSISINTLIVPQVFNKAFQANPENRSGTLKFSRKLNDPR